MASMYKQFSTDPKLEKDGVWLDYDLFRIKVARAGGANVAFSKTLEKYSKPHRRAMDTGTLSEAVARNMMYKVYAETIVLDWTTKDPEPDKNGEPVYRRGIEGPDGELMEFNKENVIKTFTALHDLYADVHTQATATSSYQADDLEADVKNSPSS